MSLKPSKLSAKLGFGGDLTLTMIIILISSFITGICGTAVAQTVKDSASVYEFVEAYQYTIRTHDPAALGAFFTEDADFMMFNLPGIRGRQAIENWWQDFWRSKFNKQESGRRGTFNLNSIRFLAADVALINIESITGGLDSLGAELQTRRARGTWLLQRQNSEWLISAMYGMPTEEDSVILGASVETAESLRPHIRTFVAAFENAWNSHNPSALGAFFRKDADLIVRNSPRIQGARAIQDWWQTYFASPRLYQAVLIIDEIRTISDEVVQLNVTATGAIPQKDAEPLPVRKTRAKWILVRQSGKWLIDALRVLPSEEDRIIRRGDK